MFGCSSDPSRSELIYLLLLLHLCLGFFLSLFFLLLLTLKLCLALLEVTTLGCFAFGSCLSYNLSEGLLDLLDLDIELLFDLFF